MNATANTEPLAGTAARRIFAEDGAIIPAGAPVVVTETRGGKFRIHATGVRSHRLTWDAVLGAVTPA